MYYESADNGMTTKHNNQPRTQGKTENKIQKQ